MELPNDSFLYTFSYHETERELCKLESKYIFNAEDDNKLLLSNIKTNPSDSAFIKKRLDIISMSNDYPALINKIKKENICSEGFKVEYIVLKGDNTEYAERLEKLRTVGFIIKGQSDYYSPKTTYALCYYKGNWYFGNLIKNNFDWLKHNQKPHSFSSSISINIAKSLVILASQAKKDQRLLDVCCGVGTIMLEACYAGQNIEGCDINAKICHAARQNLMYFNYSATVHCKDVNSLNNRYDAAIIDLPYNLSSEITEEEVLHIITSTTCITDRMVIVSTTDITDLIHSSGFDISGYCSVSKKGKSNFARKIWVCDQR